MVSTGSQSARPLETKGGHLSVGDSHTPALLPGERIVFRLHPHVLLLLLPLALLALTFLEFVLVFCPNAHSLALDGRCLPVVAMALLLTGLMVFLDWWLTRYTLTTERVLREQGIIGRQLIELALEDVQDVIVRQDILGRIFGYGTVVVESAGLHGQVRWIGIADPLRVQRTIQEARK